MIFEPNGLRMVIQSSAVHTLYTHIVMLTHEIDARFFSVNFKRYSN